MLIYMCWITLIINFVSLGLCLGKVGDTKEDWSRTDIFTQLLSSVLWAVALYLFYN